jgi:hypothetical protein
VDALLATKFGIQARGAPIVARPFERITIGVMIAWVLVMSIGFMRAERRATQRTAMATAAL